MDFVAGCIGGCAGVLVGHPFDTVKVRLQTQDPLNPRYRGTFHCLTTIVKAESVSGLFRGMSSPMVGVSLINAVIFGVYGTAAKQFADPDSLKTHYFAGMMAGITQSAITGPLELVKTRLQVQSDALNLQYSKAKYSGPFDCVRKIVIQEGGLKALTKGLGSTFLRDGPGFAAYFASYEYFTRSQLFKSNDGQSPSTAALLTAGGLAGVVSWVISYPMDIVKSRIQCSSEQKGLIETSRNMYSREGAKSFFRGINSALIRAYPTNAAIFFTVSMVYHFHEKYLQGKKALIEVEGSLAETVHQKIQHHIHYHHLGERMHLNTISNHLLIC